MSYNNTLENNSSTVKDAVNRTCYIVKNYHQNESENLDALMCIHLLFNIYDEANLIRSSISTFFF